MTAQIGSRCLSTEPPVAALAVHCRADGRPRNDSCYGTHLVSKPKSAARGVRLMGPSRDSVKDIGGPRTPNYGEGLWPGRVDEHLLDELERWVQSCCVLC